MQQGKFKRAMFQNKTSLRNTADTFRSLRTIADYGIFTGGSDEEIYSSENEIIFAG